MCRWGTERKVLIKGRYIKIDACITDEILYLNEQGVRTKNSCCGHGIDYPTAILEDYESTNRAKELGYFPISRYKYYCPDPVYEITLKGHGRPWKKVLHLYFLREQ